jgi:CheY-like chemotaxis protein
VRRLHIDRTMRLCALTGYGLEEDRALASAAGFDRHLTKPLDPAQLLTLIAQEVAPEPTVLN